MNDWEISSPHTEAIGIDIGGTQMKAVVVDRAGTVMRREMRPTAEARDFRDFAAKVRDLARELGGDLPVAIAAPGLARVDRRAIARMPGRLEGLENLDWTEWLGKKLPVIVFNDAHAALLGEAWRGAAQDLHSVMTLLGRDAPSSLRRRAHAKLRNVIMLTLGTGVGGAILIDGKLYEGAIGRAGHFGHACVDQNAAVSSITGMPGALECFFGNYNVSQRTNGRFASTHELIESVCTGDAEAARFWQASIHSLACALASLVNILDPEVIVIGGGIARAGDALFVPLREEMAKIEWRPFGEGVPIVPASLGEWAGAIGVAHETFVLQVASPTPQLHRTIHTLYQARQAETSALRNLKDLIAKGASVDATDHGITAFESAVTCGLDDAARLLEEAGANTSGRANALLHRAISSRDEGGVLAALEAGADPNGNCLHGSVLHYAAHHGGPAVTRLLLQRGAKMDSDAAFWICDDMLMDAIGLYEECIELAESLEVLFEFGADPHARNWEGKTCLEVLGTDPNPVTDVVKKAMDRTTAPASPQATETTGSP